MLKITMIWDTMVGFETLCSEYDDYDDYMTMMTEKHDDMENHGWVRDSVVYDGIHGHSH